MRNKRNHHQPAAPMVVRQPVPNVVVQREEEEEDSFTSFIKKNPIKTILILLALLGVAGCLLFLLNARSAQPISRPEIPEPPRPEPAKFPRQSLARTRRNIADDTSAAQMHPQPKASTSEFDLADPTDPDEKKLLTTYALSEETEKHYEEFCHGVNGLVIASLEQFDPRSEVILRDFLRNIKSTLIFKKSDYLVADCTMLDGSIIEVEPIMSSNQQITTRAFMRAATEYMFSQEIMMTEEQATEMVEMRKKHIILTVQLLAQYTRAILADFEFFPHNDRSRLPTLFLWVGCASKEILESKTAIGHDMQKWADALWERLSGLQKLKALRQTKGTKRVGGNTGEVAILDEFRKVRNLLVKQKSKETLADTAVKYYVADSLMSIDSGPKNLILSYLSKINLQVVKDKNELFAINKTRLTISDRVLHTSSSLVTMHLLITILRDNEKQVFAQTPSLAAKKKKLEKQACHILGREPQNPVEEMLLYLPFNRGPGTEEWEEAFNRYVAQIHTFLNAPASIFNKGASASGSGVSEVQQPIEPKITLMPGGLQGIIM